MIAIVDYGVGNLGSIANMFKKVGVEATVTSSAKEVAATERVLLPGVGAFDAGMNNLERSGLIPVLEDHVRAGKPLLGICLGMQLLTESSEEGRREGLGWLPASTKRFNLDDPSLKVPHMGWNTVDVSDPHPLFDSMGGPPRFYFLHSYFVSCDEPRHVLGTTSYGSEFASAVAKDNVYGVQFHPEKSHRFGMQLFRNFAVLN